MSLVLVLNQPLRLSRAISYAAMRQGAQKLIVTSVPSSQISLPPMTSILTFDDLNVPPPPPPGDFNRAVGRAEHWIKGGSTVGARVGRWMRAAEWRLRHLDRIRSILEYRRDVDPTAHHSAVVLVLESIAASHDVEEIVVFDLFDLPPVLTFAERRDLVVKVR